MAVVKILQIKRSHKEALEYIMDFEKTHERQKDGQEQAINYISNPDKTNEGQLVSGYNCDPDFSVAEFAMTQELAREAIGNYRNVGGADVKAHHVIQSFSPEDNITPEQAHEIGKKMIDELLGGKHEYVIATHVDKEHIHNHIVFNATSFYDLKKFRSVPYKTVSQLRAINDRLCAENNLHVLDKNQGLKSNYKQYQKYREMTSYRVQIRKRMNFLLETETDLDSLLNKAKLLDIEIDLTGKHAKYKFGAQQRNTRDSKLADTDKFTKNGLIEQLNSNRLKIELVEGAIEESFSLANNFEDFSRHLNEKHGLSIVRNRKGQVHFSFRDELNSKVTERAINPGYSIEKITSSLKNGRSLIREENLLSVKEEFDKIVLTNPSSEETPVLLANEMIEKRTKEGLLIKVQTEGDHSGFIFIDANHTEYIKEKNQYQIHLGEQFNYYFMENEKQSNYFLKGEQLVRHLEETMGVEKEMIDIPLSMVSSISEKGIVLSFPDHNVERLFLPKEAVTLDKLRQKVRIELGANWTYSYQKKVNNETSGKKKVLYESIKGGRLIQLIDKNRPMFDGPLMYKLSVYQKRASLQEAKRMAENLALLRRENVKGISGVGTKINDLMEHINETNRTLELLKTKIIEYNLVAKYLVTYQKYLALNEKVETAGFQKNYLKKKHEPELTQFHYAESELAKREINPNIQLEKVIELVKENKVREDDLIKQVQELGTQMARYEEIKELLTSIDSSLEKKKEKEKMLEKEH